MARITQTQKRKTKSRIEVLAGEGMTAPEIADALGVSVHTVYRYRDRYKIEVKEGQRGGDRRSSGEKPEVLQDIMFMASKGVEAHNISTKLKIPIPIVISIAEKNNITLRGNGAVEGEIKDNKPSKRSHSYGRDGEERNNREARSTAC